MAYNITGASLHPIHGQISDAPTYHPFEAQTFSDWSVQAGDMVTLVQGEDEYSSPIHSTRMTWKGTPQMMISSTGNKKRDAVSKVGKQKYRGGSGAMRNQQGLYYDLYSEDGKLHSSIVFTASILRTEFDAANSTLYSIIEQTATYIKSEVASVQSDMRSLILQTPEMIHSEVGSAVSGFAQSVIEQTATYIRQEVSNAASAISASVIEQTTEYVRTEVASVASGIAWSVVEQTMTGIISEVGKKAQIFVQMEDPVTTATVYEKDIWIQTNGVRTWNEFGAAQWNNRANSLWRQYYGEKMFVRHNGRWEKINDSSTAVEQGVEIVHNEEEYSLLAHKVDLDNQEYNSKLQVTAERIRGEVSVAGSMIYSVIEQTATNVFSGVYDKVHDNFSTIEQTATAISLAVNSAKSSLYSAINVTSTQISLKVGKGEVISWINQSAESIVISADKIDLRGVVKTDQFTANVIKTKIAEMTGVTLNGVTVNGSAAFNGSLLVATGSDAYGSVYSSVKDAIYNLQITRSGNTYTLQRKRFNESSWTDVGSFSRAVTDFNYSWSGGQLTVTAQPQGNSKAILGVKTTGSWSGDTYNGRIVYWDGTDDDGPTYNTGSTFSITGGGGSHSITITPDTVGKSSEPSGTELWSTTSFINNRWYVMTVKCGTATKVYKIHIK